MMGVPRSWTAEEDRLLLSLREQGVIWDTVSVALKISRTTCIARARQLGVLKKFSALPAATAVVVVQASAATWRPDFLGRHHARHVA